MPIVTATPRGQSNGDMVTEFVDSVGTTSVTYRYPSAQDEISIRNSGTVDLNVTAGSTVTVAPRESKIIIGPFTNLVISSSSGIGSFEARATANVPVATNGPSAGAFGGIMASLDAGESASIQVVGDSTGNDITYEWVGLTSTWFGKMYPDLRVQQKVWNDTTQEYDPWTVIQTGSNGERHALFAGNSRTMYLPPSHIPAITGDIDVRVKVSLDDWTPAANQTLVARFGGAALRAWNIYVNSTGRFLFQWSADGTALLSVASSNPLSIVNGDTIWLRATLDVDSGSGGYTCTLYTSPDSSVWTQVGVATTTTGVTSIFNPVAQEYEIGGRGFVGELVSGKIFEIQIRDGIGGKIINPQPIDSWIPRSLSGVNPATTFSGSPTLYVVNGSKPGGGITYFNDSIRLPLMVQPYYGALVFVSTSHNEGDSVGLAWASSLDSFYSALKNRLPISEFCFLTQNPQVAPRTIDQIKPHAQRRREMMIWAARNDVYLIDTFKDFLDDTRGLSALINSDGIHPSNVVDNFAGSKLWSDTVNKVFASRK